MIIGTRHYEWMWCPRDYDTNQYHECNMISLRGQTPVLSLDPKVHVSHKDFYLKYSWNDKSRIENEIFMILTPCQA